MKGTINTLLALLLIVMLLSTFTCSTLAESATSPPTPRFKLTVPRVNEIIYMINLKNTKNQETWFRLDFAIPKTWPPDTYIELKDINTDIEVQVRNYSDRGNKYFFLIGHLPPMGTMQINITLYSLKYKLEYYTHKRVNYLSYPERFLNYTKPEKFIESNNTLIINKAVALAGSLKNPFRIAERVYDFVISYLKYERQTEAKGALWALINGRGDCTEYGTLFTALMRALSIPSRVVIGLKSEELSRGGLVNVSESSHLWAEFYVEDFGWVPVDPTSGERNATRYFGILWSFYIPFLKGPTMNPPYRSLLTIKSEPSKAVNYTAQLIVSPLPYLPFTSGAIKDLYYANNLTNILRRRAYQAYKYSFNISRVYPLIEETYELLFNSTAVINENPTMSSEYSKEAAKDAIKALNSIFNIAISYSRNAILNAWKETRILGALSGEYYIRKAYTLLSKGMYAEALDNLYYAKITAEKAPSVFVFIGPLLLCIITMWIIRKRNK